ncbi:MAG: flippase [Chloroflexales bacterium]|nr:flippase [Chloroflexales bacterium]
MSSSGKTLAKNASVMMVSQVLTWALAVVFAIFLPRYLGATAVGELSISFAIWILVGVILSFGTDLYLTKTIAINPSRAGELTMTSIVMRSLLFIPGSLLVLLFLYVMHYSGEVIYVVALIGIHIFFTQISGAQIAALVGLERMEYVSLTNIVSKGLLTGMSLLLLFLGLSVYSVGISYIISSVIAVAIQGRALAKHTTLRLNVNPGSLWAMMRGGAPYLVTGMTLIAYQQVDKLFISAMVATKALGWYGTAMNLFGTMMFVPVVIGTVLLPMLSRAYSSGSDTLAPMARRSFDLMFMFSIPIGLGLSVVAEPLVLLLYGPEFAPAGDILGILGIVLIFTYLNTALAQLLIAAERTGKWNIVMIVAVLLTLPLDLMLVPWAERVFGNGALGGAISFSITELLMLAAAILLLPKGTLNWRNVRTVVLSLAAGLGMVAVAWSLRDFNLVLAVLAGGVIYPVLVLLLRILSPEDIELLKAGVTQVIAKLRGGKRASASLGSD